MLITHHKRILFHFTPPSKKKAWTPLVAGLLASMKFVQNLVFLEILKDLNFSEALAVFVGFDLHLSSLEISRNHNGINIKLQAFKYTHTDNLILGFLFDLTQNKGVHLIINILPFDIEKVHNIKLKI